MAARRFFIAVRSLALAALVAGLPLAGTTGTPPWQEAPYSMYATNEPVGEVLRKFAANFNLQTDIDPALQGEVTGKFNLASPTEFMDKLGGAYGFKWFVHAGTLYVSPSSASVTRTISIGSGGAGRRGGAMRQALVDLGILNERFGWGELPDQGLALVSGPPQYLKLIEDTLAALPATARGGQLVQVFRLKHASVDDRTIIYRDKEISTPGLASVLRGLLGVGGGGETYGDAGGTTMNPGRGLSNLAPSQDIARTPISASGSASGASAPAGGSGERDAGRADAGRADAGPQPSIQADSRLNAVIVRDTPERMPIYEKLIAQLDSPTPLIEIEALIIDVNSQNLDELGIAWNAVNNGVALGYGDINTPIDSNTLSVVSANRAANPTPGATLLTGAASYLIARLRLLEQKGQARIQARPSILTMDNVGALIDLSETFYIRTTGERVATVTPVTVGTTLRVTPRRVTQNDQEVVRLVVDIEDGQIQDVQVDNLPTVRRSNVSTQAVVRKDEGLLLGGYKIEQNVRSKSGIPVLGSLPVVGALFSTTSDNVERRERLFLIRPKIVGVPDEQGVMRYVDASSAMEPIQVIPPEKDPGPQARP